MKVIVPLAGLGTRLRPHTFSTPKPLINIAGKPVLGHVIDMFNDMNPDEFIFVTGYLGKQIENYLDNEHPMLRKRCVEQVNMDGQSPAILLAKDFIDGPVLLVFADTLIEANLTSLKTEPNQSLALVKRVKDPRRFGVAEVGNDGYVTRLIEKPSSRTNNLVVAGFYYLTDGPGLMDAIEKQMSSDIQTKGEYYLADALQIMIDRGLKLRVREVDVWEDCGKPETVLHTNKYLLEHGHDNSPELNNDRFIVVPPVNIHPSAQIRNSVIGPYTTIGPHCDIDSSIIRDSIVGEGTQVEDAMLTQSLVGPRAQIKGDFHSLNVSEGSQASY